MNFGDDHDFLQTVKDTSLIARIQSVAIKGNAYGSLAAGDHFGFVAQLIGQFKFAGQSVALTAGSGNDSYAIPLVGDMILKEVS